jgi:hypothetical protein
VASNRDRAEAILIAAWREMTPKRKLELVSSLAIAAQRISLTGLRLRYPDAADEEPRLRLGALRLPVDTMVGIFGWDSRVQEY